MKKKVDNRDFKMVYSTDPSFKPEDDTRPESDTLAPGKQRLRLILDSKQRAGKTVTAVVGYIGKSEDIEALAKKLKAHCGTGGSVKDGEILIQGDQREKLRQVLEKSGYKVY